MCRVDIVSLKTMRLPCYIGAHDLIVPSAGSKLYQVEILHDYIVHCH